MRYFLIDKVTELEVGRRVRGVKNISLSDEVLHDHFPDLPVFPGALILEAAAQLAGFLLEVSLNQSAETAQRALLAQVELAKFYDISGPGDQLQLEIEIVDLRSPAAQVTLDAKVDDRQIAKARLTFLMKRIESPRIHEQRRYIYTLWTRNLKTPVTIL